MVNTNQSSFAHRKRLKIAILGKRGSGKSTLANYLAKDNDFQVVKFSEPFDRICRAINESEHYDRGLISLVGAEIRRELPGFQNIVMKNYLNSTDQSVIIEGLRFQEELEFCRNHNFLIVWLKIDSQLQIERLEDRYRDSEILLREINHQDEDLLHGDCMYDLEINSEIATEEQANIIITYLGVDF